MTWCFRSAIIAALQTVLLTGTSPAIAKDSGEVPQLRADKLKLLIRREPRCQDLIPKVEKVIAESGHKSTAQKRREFLEHTIMSAGSLSEARLSDAVDLLEHLTSNCQLLSAEDLKHLQSQYQKLCELLDDQILAKDLEAALNLHDRFIRLSDLGVWDKEQSAAQIERIKQAVSRAPGIPYGRLELLRNLQGKTPAAANQGCSLGVASRDHVFLSANRDSVTVLEESTGANIQIEAADMIIQGTDGKLYDLTSANHPDNHLPFSPPLSLWYKSRLLEGHIPALQFRLNNKTFINPHEDLCIQDILDGNLDEYLLRNLKEIASTKAAVMVGLGADFDRELAATAFGADGRTPYYFLIDSKLSKLSPEKLHEELERRLSKGAFLKDSGSELKTGYGDPNIPDGPERVRDAWKHWHKLIQQAAAQHVSTYACTGSFHGNKKALGFPNSYQAGAQEWNKLEYYWPGSGVLNWIGAAATGSEPEMNVNAYSLLASLDYFMEEAKASPWRNTPVILSSLGPGKILPGAQESAWLSACFQSLLPSVYQYVKACVLSFPQQISLQSPESFSTFRRGVANNAYYKQALRLQTPAGNTSVSSTP